LRIIACCCGLAIAFAASSRSQGAGQTDTARILTEIQRIESALPNIADRGAALYLLARRYASAGDRERALAVLTECLSLNEGFEPDTAALQTLQTFPAIRTIVDRFRQGHPPVHRARVAFTVPETDLFPEGLAFDGDKRVFYLSSEYHNKIVKVDANHDVSDFVSPDRYQLSPVGGLRVDPVDHTLWAATDSAEFVHVDANGQLLDRFSAPDPGPHILNDLVVRRSSRDVYVTDTRAHLVYRFDRQARTFAPLTFHRPLFYPNGIALSPDERLLFVADLMGVIVVDLRTGNTHDVRPDRSDTLAGIDGLYWHENGLIGVQYGTGAYRVMRWRLSRDTRRAVASEVLEYRTDLVSFPTTGAIVADDFYFIANTGIGNLQDGHIVDRTKLEPVHVAVVNLR
jgi:sugar lactone lactonase YvrE